MYQYLIIVIGLDCQSNIATLCRRLEIVVVAAN